MTDLIVLGAGPAGLMAAYRAARNGRTCRVVEASDRVGGMAGSFEVAGQRVDYGSHRLHPAAHPDVLALIQSLLGDDLQVRPRRGRLRLAGRWVGFPLRAGELIRTLPPGFGARLALEAARATIGGVLSNSGGVHPSFDDEVRARFGSTVADRFYGPYARKLYGLDPTELDGELARRRISATSPTAIAARLARAARPAGRTFLYPRRGYGQIVERLAAAAVDAGAEITLSSPVAAVALDDDGVQITVADGTRYDAATAVSTIPLPSLARSLEPTPPDDVVEALGAIRTRAMVLVYLVVDRPQYTRFDAHYLPDPEVTVARLSEPKNYRDGPDPDGLTVLCAELACWPTDELWTLPPAEAGELVMADLERVGLPSFTPSEVHVRHLRSVYPVLDRASANARATVEGWGGTTDRLITTGRQGLLGLDNLHHVLEMGGAASTSIDRTGRVDAPMWRQHLDRFARHVVED